MFSFTARKKAVEYQRYIRRIIDLTIPNKSNTASTDRFENRHNRAIPALLCPWENGGPVVEASAIVITKDVSDKGVGLIVTRPFEAKNVLLAFYLRDATTSEPWFFRGIAEHNVAIGGGFWLLGIALSEYMNEDWQVELAPLLPLAQRLLPPQES